MMRFRVIMIVAFLSLLFGSMAITPRAQSQEKDTIIKQKSRDSIPPVQKTGKENVEFQSQKFDKNIDKLDSLLTVDRSVEDLKIQLATLKKSNARLQKIVDLIPRKVLSEYELRLANRVEVTIDSSANNVSTLPEVKPEQPKRKTLLQKLRLKK